MSKSAGEGLHAEHAQIAVSRQRHPASSPAVVSIWNDIDPEIEAEYEAWYQRDHLRDRVGIPGFRSCRRYVRVRGDGRQYFTFSDLDSIEVTTSPAYVTQLANATAWTRRIMPHFRRLIRIAANVTVDRGDGTGGFAATVPCEGLDEDRRADARRAIEAALDDVMQDARVTRVRVFESYAAGSVGVPNPEAALRPDPQRIADLAIVVEGSCQAAVSKHLSTLMALPELALANVAMPATVYQLMFSSRH